MNRRWIMASVLAWPLVACGAPATREAPQQSEAQRLEKFAVSQCLQRAFPDTSFGADARRASGAYVELGSADADVYGEIAALVGTHLAKPYQSKSGEPLHVMQCLDLLQSPALATLVKPYR
ncbi:T6SS amidase immunity protein Tai4 family protein [Orrella dioscoreae]|nr:T6SS amidase immunity protein Tai4 family protein [Orrella dioscoreae]